MALTHRIKLTKSDSPGTYDIYYRLNGQLDFTLFRSDVYDAEFSSGICIELPSNAVELKIINKYLNSNTVVYKPVIQ